MKNCRTRNGVLWRTGDSGGASPSDAEGLSGSSGGGEDMGPEVSRVGVASFKRRP